MVADVRCTFIDPTCCVRLNIEKWISQLNKLSNFGKYELKKSIINVLPLVLSNTLELTKYDEFT